MQVRPGRLNGAIAWLFMVGSACFALGSVPAYLNAVGGPIDGVTYFVGSLFFTTASFASSCSAQTPGHDRGRRRGQASATVRLRWRAWLPHDRGWLAAVTQFPGTLCFNVSTSPRWSTTRRSRRRIATSGVPISTVRCSSSSPVCSGCWRSGRWPAAPAAVSLPWRIAWWNMTGSILFMASALASYILPTGS